MMSEWREIALGDLITLHYGKALRTTDRIIGNIPVYSSAGLTGWHNKPLINSTSIIIGRKGTIGKVYLSNTPSWCIDTAYYILPDDEKYNFKYLYFLLQTIGFEDLNEDSAVPGLNRNTAYRQEILIPPLPEQTAIASVLSSLDDKIDLLHRQNETLEKMAETLFRQWFIEEAKEEWEEGTLGDLVISANTGLDAIRRAPIVENFTGIKCLRIQDISQNKPISNWGNTMVTDKDFKKAQLKKGDIIMARTCSPGILLFVQEDLPAVFNNGLAKIKANLDNCHPLYLKYLFTTKEFINHIYGISDGTAVQLNMKLGDLLSYVLLIPPKECILNFVKITKDWNIKISFNQNQIRTLTQLRDTLLPKLMNGDVRVV